MRSQDAAKARAAEEARADALAQLKHFAFAWMNNCQDLHDFTANLQDFLNKSLYEAHERELSMIETATQQGLTLVPLTVHFVRGRVKIGLAMARGRRLYDKREKLKARSAREEMQNTGR